MKRASTDPDLLKTVQTAMSRQRLAPAHGVVVVGVSGGPDSVCLLHMLKRLCESGGAFAGVKLHVAHLDHGLRGEVGQADAAFVADLAAQWGLPCTLGQADVPALARTERRSLEDAARQARYAFLRRVAAEVGAERIAVAHQADDQVETLVMHWLRGSGLAGLAGMQVQEGDVIRPLLGVRRVEIFRYCAQQGLAYREDASNQDRRFLRNRIRHELLPTLEQYNPNLRETLRRNAAVLAEEDASMQAQVDVCWSEVFTREAEGNLEGNIAAYRRLPLALRRRVLLRAALRVSGEEVHLGLRHVEASDALLLRSVGVGALHLPGGLRLRRIYGQFVIASELSSAQRIQTALDTSARSAPALPAENYAAIILPVPGEANLPGTRWVVRAHSLDEKDTPPPGYERGEDGRRWGYLDLDTLMGYLPLSVRTRRVGDRFQTLGLRSAKKLQDVLVNAKVPRAERDTLPLVCGADGTILWVAGYQIADPVKLTPATRRALALEVETIDANRSGR